jgi:sulfur-oxidizing protein SoxX
MVHAASEIEQGRSIAFDQTRGNCLACHAIAGGESPGNIGPALSDMKARYPDISVLRARIWDETAFNPETVMPPFGKHRILSESEIDLVLEFLYTL